MNPYETQILRRLAQAWPGSLSRDELGPRAAVSPLPRLLLNRTILQLPDESFVLASAPDERLRRRPIS